MTRDFEDQPLDFLDEVLQTQNLLPPDQEYNYGSTYPTSQGNGNPNEDEDKDGEDQIYVIFKNKKIRVRGGKKGDYKSKISPYISAKVLEEIQTLEFKNAIKNWC